MIRSLFLLLPFLLFGAPLKIIDLKENNDVVSIVFNKNIQSSQFKKYKISTGIYYDVKAEYTLKKYTFRLKNENFITIAQNSKNIARIVIQSKKINTLNFKIKKNTLLLSFAKKADASNTANNVNNATHSEISNLFNSISTAKDGSNTAQNSKKPKGEQVVRQNNARTNITRIIVLDPGHGGKDCGANIDKICEKDITLSISKTAKKILESRGYKVYITRDSDKYISLTDRTKFANDKNADIFVSIHANSLPKSSKNYSTTSGIETYFLSTARSERARKVAELENKDDIEVMNYFSKLSFLNSINSQRLLASNKLAIDVQYGMLVNTRKLYSKTIDGGVREGPFWVLVGALMPSILVEVGYMSNDDDLEKLQKKSYQEKLAIGIADGIDNYFLKNF